ncbi:hypothetical protein CCR97_07930 [Rhodoplanes elegans]|uniref:Uncharacterized protein n=1 Tax=Rhodoplanes elegans TaxID=29408 RepID=A0A327KR67_9BRAD|nr:hypothetical protein [Rhodoplanes elegans]MBK5958047.1 hypothetical protein [Rhodoplanes elegans]MBK5958139.1 hypothetical protein [Rhodoplanes elegans]RAI40426.1 hypothetical protein CH338_06180 [Rhodoplanes elegans]
MTIDPDFSDQLSKLCSRECVHARKDPARAAVMIERLVHSLGLTIAVASRGDPGVMNTLCEGASQQLFQSASGMADVSVQGRRQ